MKPKTGNLKQDLIVGVVCVAVASLIVGIGLILWRSSEDTSHTPDPFSALEPDPTSLFYLPHVASNSPLPTLILTTAATLIPSSPTLVRGPYLQSVTTSSIIVVWEIDFPSSGAVVYGETEAYGSSVVDPAMDTRHAVTLTDLTPYTAYHYRVESGGTPLSEDATFRTASPPSVPPIGGEEGGAFTFIVFGDTRTQHQIHHTVARRIATLAPDFVLHTGDLVEFGNDAHEWETFFEIEQELMAHTPFFPALGNHEGNSPYYFDLFYLPGNERWYSFDYGNARFLCLKVNSIWGFAPGSEQYAWLEETLAANTQPWLFVYFHIPPYTSTQSSLEDIVRQTLTPLFEQYGVDVVFTSHKHNYERNKVRGVTYIVTGGGGAPLYPMQEREPTQVAFAMAHHVVLLKVDNHRLEATVISVEGKVLDKFERSVN